MRRSKKWRRKTRKRRKKTGGAEEERKARRTQQILGIATSGTDRRGLDAEEKVARALRYFQERKTLFHDGRIITGFQRTMHYDSDDQAGKDFIVTLKANGQEESLSVQVKNSWSLVVQRRYAARGICFIGVWPDEDNEQARKRVAVAISNFSRIQDERKKELEINTLQKVWRFVKRLLRIHSKKTTKLIEKLQCKRCKRLYYTVVTPGLICPNCGAKI